MSKKFVDKVVTSKWCYPIFFSPAADNCGEERYIIKPI